MHDWKQYVRQRVAELKLHPVREAEIVEELAQHLADAYEEARAAGATEAEAQQRAVAELEESALARELLRAERPALEPMPPIELRGGNMLESVWQDVRYGLRTLRKSPLFALVAVITLALGIGANTAIFSVVNAALLRPLPYEDPDRLVHLWTTHQRKAFDRSELAYPNYLDYRARNQVFTGMAGYNGNSFTLTGRGLPERLPAERVSASFFPVLGVKPYLGRFFTEEEEPAGTARVVILSYGAWQSRFGADPNILGQVLVLTGEPYTVIGVLPREFYFAPARTAELWTPPYATEDQRTRRSLFWFNTIARLRPGVTPEQAQAEMDGLAKQLAAAYPQTNTGTGIAVVPLREQFLGDTRDAVLVLLGAAGFLLLIACVNLANLLLARATSREREMAVRAALGASPLRLARQVLVESALLSVAGGAAGLLAAYWGVGLLLAAVPERILAQAPYLLNARMDATVLLFALAVSVVTGCLFGLVPALHASLVNLQSCLKEGSRTTGGSGRSALRGALVTAEVALALVLAVGTGLFLQSVWRLAGADPGFRKENVLFFRVSISSVRYPEDPQVVNFYRLLRERLGTLPGVQEVAVTSHAPLTGDGNTVRLKVDGQPDPKPGEESDAVLRDVSPNHFSVLGVPLRAGRFFTERDNATAPQVAILSETLARHLFGNENPIGRSVYIFVTRSAWQVVGVVGDISLASVDTRIRPVLYTCNLQGPSRSTDVIVRAATEPTALLPAIRREVSAIDPEVAVFGVATMDEAQMNAQSVFQRRALATLLGIFAGLALILAAVGIYGVMSYTVTQRWHEIGIRMALGAQRGDIFRLVVGEGMRLTLLGVAIGLAGAFGLTRFLASLLFGVKPADPLTFAAVAALLAVVAFAACFLPARRATRVDPMVALRYE